MHSKKSYFIIAALILLFFIFSCSTPFQEKQAVRINREIISNFIEELKSGNSQKVVSYLAPDIEWVVAGDPARIPFAGTYHQINEVNRFLKLFYQTVMVSQITTTTLTESRPGSLEAFLRLEGKIPATGRKIDIEFFYTWILNEKQEITKISTKYALVSMELALINEGKGKIVSDISASKEAVKITQFFKLVRDFAKIVSYNVIIAVMRAPVNPPPVPEEGSYELVTIKGIKCEKVMTTGNSTDKIILNFHGGAFIGGSAIEKRGFSFLLARVSHIPVLTFDYRLARENPFPAAPDDCYAVYKEMLKIYQARNIAFVGDSAGGSLALATLLRAGQNNLPLPGVVVCLSPWLDISDSGETMLTNAASDTLLSKKYLDRCREWYLGDSGTAAVDPLVSPLFGDVSCFPPVYLAASTTEVLLSDSTRMFNLLTGKNIETTIEIASDLVHVWPGFCTDLPDGMRTITRIGEFIEKQLNK